LCAGSNRHGHSDSNAYAHTYIDVDWGGESHGDVNANADADGHSDEPGDAYSDFDAECHGDCCQCGDHGDVAAGSWWLHRCRGQLHLSI
jgi:hypothetical protein